MSALTLTTSYANGTRLLAMPKYHKILTISKTLQTENVPQMTTMGGHSIPMISYKHTGCE